MLLSEAPRRAEIQRLQARLGEAWSYGWVEHPAGQPYWYRLVVLSRWPVTVVEHRPLHRGYAMLARVEHPQVDLRVMIVDGQSDPRRDRKATMKDALRMLDRAQRQGPVHVVAGDFNTPGRSVAFDGLRARGYRLASEHVGGWRATWPRTWPLFDVDHVWLHPRMMLGQGELFSHPASDHRGLQIEVTPPVMTAR